MQQFDKQVRLRYTRLFAPSTPIDGIPTANQKRKFIEENYSQTTKILETITNYNYQQINYIQSLSVASVFKILNDFIDRQKQNDFIDRQKQKK